MCIHDEDDATCSNCCYEIGYDDAMDGEPKEPEFKNGWQIDEYELGYEAGLKDKESSGWWEE